MRNDRRINEVVLVCVTLWMVVWIALLMSKVSSLQSELSALKRERYVKLSQEGQIVLRPIQPMIIRKYDYGSITSH